MERSRHCCRSVSYTHLDVYKRQVVDSAVFIGGPYVKELEEKLASFTGRKHCITCALSLIHI